MSIDFIEQKKETRLFTFGCSFTQYIWPTWADILGKQYDYFENWGRLGSGNLYIFNSLIECIIRNNITKNDNIVIMWTDLARNDVYYNNSWQGDGNMLSLNLIDPDKILHIIGDSRGAMIKNFAFIESAKIILQSIGCRYKFLSMVPFSKIKTFDNKLIEVPKDILKLYNNSLKLVNPSMFELEYNNDWDSLPLAANYSYYSMYDYRQLIEDLKKYYDTVKGVSWPLWDDFINNKINSFDKSFNNEWKELGITDQINNINVAKLNGKKLLKIASKYFKTSNPKDYHPLPLTHLSYIQRHFDIPNKTLNWTKSVQDQILNDTFVTFNRNLPQRL